MLRVAVPVCLFAIFLAPYVSLPRPGSEGLHAALLAFNFVKVRTLIGGLTLAAVVLVLGFGRHLEAAAFGMLPLTRERERIGRQLRDAQDAILLRSCDWLVVIFGAISLLRVGEIYQRLGKEGLSEFLVKCPPALVVLLLCVPYVCLSGARRVKLLRYTGLLAVPMTMDILRITVQPVLCHLLGLPPLASIFTFELEVFREAPIRSWSTSCLLVVSLLSVFTLHGKKRAMRPH